MGIQLPNHKEPASYLQFCILIIFTILYFAAKNLLMTWE